MSRDVNWELIYFQVEGDENTAYSDNYTAKYNGCSDLLKESMLYNNFEMGRQQSAENLSRHINVGNVIE